MLQSSVASECNYRCPQPVEMYHSSHESHCDNIPFTPHLPNQLVHLLSHTTCCTHYSNCQRSFLNFPGSGAILSLLLVLMRCVQSWDTFVPNTLSLRIKNP